MADVAEVNVSCCSTMTPLVFSDADDPTVFEIRCKTCDAELAFIHDRSVWRPCEDGDCDSLDHDFDRMAHRA